MKSCVIGLTLLFSFMGLALILNANYATADPSPMLEKTQKKQNDKKAPGLHNMIDKHGKKESGDPVEVTPAPETSTPKQKSQDYDRQQEHSDDKIRRIIELTVVSCCITVAIVVLILSMRLAYLICRNCQRHYENQERRRRRRASAEAQEPTVHYTNSLASIASGGTTPPTMNPSGPASIYTVMPGHFVLQPCFPSTSTSQVAGPGPSTSAVASGLPLPGSSSGDPLQVVTSYRMRPETPPPPYPGPKLEDDGKLG